MNITDTTEHMNHRGALREIPYMGVIYVVAEAMKLGFTNGDPDWCNLGQGQPEVGPMAGAPPRINQMTLEPSDHAYGPIGGTEAFREAVARHYNRLYRQGKASQYTAENVSVAAGGRLVLTRIFSALGAVRMGYQIPDYTAYEDMINAHLHRVTPVLVRTHADERFRIAPDAFRPLVEAQRLDAYLMSNPCNPTGQVVQGEALAERVRVARAHDCTLILDEFYSHFIYTPEGRPAPGPVSAARYVEDVDRDPVLLVDGLTKCFRYPGWRLGWAVGPRDMITSLGCAASAVDGGPGQPVQRAALQVLEAARADQETRALRQVFARKRKLMVERLDEMGFKFADQSESTFYVWVNIEDLPAPLHNAERLFREALSRKVLTVPGKFFDVNPGQNRAGLSPYAQWMRLSFGPPEENVILGLDRLATLIEDAHTGSL